MAELKKIEREYILKTSPGVIFSFLTEPSGLAEWFCDHVDNKGNLYTFTWNKDSEQKAKLLSSRENSFVKYQWTDGPEDAYFELRLLVDDLTSELALIVTDFAEEDDVDETKLFWNSAIQRLHGVIGS